jgi:hypothetical protein
MKINAFALVAVFLAAPAVAGPQPAQAAQPGQAQASAAAEAAQVQQPPPPSKSVSEFIGRTVVVARQQAEDEVHYETRRQVNRVFNRLLGR